MVDNYDELVQSYNMLIEELWRIEASANCALEEIISRIGGVLRCKFEDKAYIFDSRFTRTFLEDVEKNLIAKILLE